MANKKFTDLTELATTPADGDILCVIDDPSGTATSKKVTRANLVGGLMSDVADDTTPQLGGDLDAQAHHIGFTQQTIAYNSGTTTIDWGLGNKATMIFGAGNITTFAFTDPPKPSNLTLKIVQDGTGSRLVSAWDADIKWAGGSAPTLTTDADAIDIISFYWDGTNYFGVGSLDFS
ncbi:MAG: hypothetical protein DRP42_02765 [Tenericutes bacterium]|nr:MAG: hypothetical protein DRP42_02765 [Mycoplasmatota bacterium]